MNGIDPARIEQLLLLFNTNTYNTNHPTTAAYKPNTRARKLSRNQTQPTPGTRRTPAQTFDTPRSDLQNSHRSLSSPTLTKPRLLNSNHLFPRIPRGSKRCRQSRGSSARTSYTVRSFSYCIITLLKLSSIGCLQFILFNGITRITRLNDKLLLADWCMVPSPMKSYIQPSDS